MNNTELIKETVKKTNQSAKSRLENRKYSDLANLIWNIIPEPLVLLDSDFKIVKANDSFYRTFNILTQPADGMSFFEFDNHMWDIPKLREALDQTRLQPTAIDIDVEHTFASNGYRIVRLSIRPVLEPKPQALLLLIMRDITEQEQQNRQLEALVKERTDAFAALQKESHECQMSAEIALSEIHHLKDQLEAEKAYLIEEIKLEYNHDNIIGQSEQLATILHKIEQIAPTDTTVLILGETGTGKELVARAIHHLSLRKDRAFVKINCATLPATLIESELFGHEKGAFTGAHAKRMGRFDLAHNATLFLDEIGELPMELQSKLLRVLQDGEFERLGSSQTTKVNVRIVAATNRCLEEEVSKGRFRQDLYYRLNVFPINVPPLRERVDDIPLLVNFFVKKIAVRLGKTIELIPNNVMNSLMSYQWPGNIRELENVIERAVINSSGAKLILADELKSPFNLANSSSNTLESIEREHILRVLEQTKWKISGKNSTAEILGLDRSTLRARMKKLGIQKT